MRRRSLLGAAALSALTACAHGAPTKWPSADWRRSVDPCYVLMFQNMGGGHRMDGTGKGRILLVDPQSGRIVEELPYRPMDQGMLACDGERAAWLSAEGAHLLSDHLTTHPGLPADGSIYELLPAGQGFLGVLNAGQREGEKYRSGLVLFDATSARQWLFPGWIAGVGWVNGQVVGYTSPDISESDVQLTAMGPGPEQGKALAVTPGSVELWLRTLVAHDHEAITLAATDGGTGAAILRVDCRTGESTLIPLVGHEMRGPGSPGDPHTINDVCFIDDDGVVWHSESGLWSSALATGETVCLLRRAEDDQSSWHPQTDSVVRVERVGGGQTYEVSTVSIQTKAMVHEAIRIDVEGSEDQFNWGAGLLHGLPGGRGKST